MNKLLVLVLLILAIAHIIDADAACNDNNGGCSHICIQRSAARECHCPCGFSLDVDDTTCQSDQSCMTEYYIVIDKFLYVDESICSSGNTDELNTLVNNLKNNALAVLDMMSEYHSKDSSKAKYFIKTIDTNVQTIKRLSTELDDVKTFINSITAETIKNDCDNDTPGSYAEGLSTAITDGGLNTDRSSTTRIAVFILGSSDRITDSELQSRTDILTTDFDYTVVWTTKQFNSSYQEEHLSHTRSLACGRSTLSNENCLYHFYFDNVADGSFVPTVDTLYKVVNTQKCMLGDLLTPTLESCGPGMNVRVSKCALGGLDPAQDLKLTDSSCSPEITNIANVETDGYYDLRIPYENCGTSFKYKDRRDTEMVFQNKISTSDLLGAQSFELDVTCTVKTTSDPVFSVEFGPTPSFIRSETDSTGNNLPDVVLKFYSDSSRATEIGETEMIATGTTVYGRATSSFPDNIILRLRKLQAGKVYPFDDPMIMYGVCPNEATLVVNQVDSQNIDFEFKMFEWQSDQAESDNSQKTPVFIEATFHACDDGDDSGECQFFECSSGLSRVKRRVSETKTVKTTVRALNRISVNEDTIEQTKRSKIFEGIIVKLKHFGRIEFLGTRSNFVLLLFITLGAFLNSILISKYFGQKIEH